jgi:hypothetical protein
VAEALSPSDRSSLAAERGTVNMAMAGVMVFDAGPGLGYTRVRPPAPMTPLNREISPTGGSRWPAATWPR